VSILNSHITRSDNNDLELIIAGQNTFLIISGCKIDSKNFNGILIQNQSTCSISNSEIQNCKLGITVQDNSKGHFNHCKIFHGISKSTSILIQNSSSAKIFNCSFSKTTYPSVLAQNKSKLHLSNSKFHEIEGNYIYIKDQSQAKIHQCSIDNVQTKYTPFSFENSQVEIYDCNFSKIFDCSPIYSKNSDLIVGRCNFNEGNDAAIYLYDHSKGNIFSCQIKNIIHSGIVVNRNSQANINDILIEKCFQGIYSSFKSTVKASNCQFLQISQASTLCIDGAILEMNGCKYRNSKFPFFNSYTGGWIKIISSSVQQPDNSIPLFNISMKGKLSLSQVIIEYQGKINFEEDFINSIFNDIRDTLIDRNMCHFSKNQPISNIFRNLTCIKCKNQANGPYFFPCFHKPFCSNCYQCSNIQQCNICQLQIEKTLNSNVLESIETCSICYENPALKVIIPCGHRFCQQCIN
jgi:hypothetical protein